MINRKYYPDINQTKPNQIFLRLKFSLTLLFTFSHFLQAQIHIRDSVSIIPKLQLEHALSEFGTGASPTASFAIKFSCAKDANNVRILHYNNCSSVYDVDAMVNNNSNFINTFSAPFGQTGISFFYYAWEVDSAPPLHYSIDAVISATGESFHQEGMVNPRPVVGNSFLSAGITIPLSYMTSFEFSLWNGVQFNEIYNFSTATSLFTPPTGFKPPGRFYSYNDRCGKTYWFPNTEPMELKITAGEQYAAFYDKTNGTRLGSSFSTMFSSLGKVKLVIEDTPTEQTPLTIQSTGGTIIKSQTTYIAAYPLDRFTVQTVPDTISPGSETQIYITPLGRNEEELSSDHYVYISCDDTSAIARFEMRYPAETGWAWESLPANTMYGFSTQYSRSGYLYYIADMSNTQSNRQITFTVKDSYNPKKTGTGPVFIKGEEKLCLAISIIPPRIKAGDTATIYVKGKKDDGTFIDYPAGTAFNFSVMSGAEYGRIVGNNSPAQFIAKEDFNGDSALIIISCSPVTNGTVSQKKNQANLAANNECGIPLANVLVENDKCPLEMKCSMTVPTIPQITVDTKSFLEVPPDKDRCKPDSDGKIPLAQFAPITENSSDGLINEFTYDEKNISYCCDEQSKNWVIQLPPVVMHSVLDFCPKGIEGLKDFNPCDPVFRYKSKNMIKDWLTKNETTYPTLTKTIGEIDYYVREATLEHERVHQSDYQENIYKAAFFIITSKEHGNDLFLSKTQYKTIAEVKEAVKMRVKNIFTAIFNKANEFRHDLVGDENSPKREKYEENTQRNDRVQLVYEKYKKVIDDPAQYCN